MHSPHHKSHRKPPQRLPSPKTSLWLADWNFQGIIFVELRLQSFLRLECHSRVAWAKFRKKAQPIIWSDFFQQQQSHTKKIFLGITSSWLCGDKFCGCCDLWVRFGSVQMFFFPLVDYYRASPTQHCGGLLTKDRSPQDFPSCVKKEAFLSEYVTLWLIPNTQYQLPLFPWCLSFRNRDHFWELKDRGNACQVWLRAVVWAMGWGGCGWVCSSFVCLGFRERKMWGCKCSADWWHSGG